MPRREELKTRHGFRAFFSFPVSRAQRPAWCLGLQVPSPPGPGRAPSPADRRSLRSRGQAALRGGPSRAGGRSSAAARPLRPAGARRWQRRCRPSPFPGAAMKSLCLVTVGVLAMTLLIASISLLVAHVFQTVVDLQVKQVREWRIPTPMPLDWFIPSRNNPGRRGRGLVGGVFWLPPCSSCGRAMAGAPPGGETPVPCTIWPGWSLSWSSGCTGPGLGKNGVNMSKNQLS